jgi:hypothetical protein
MKGGDNMILRKQFEENGLVAVIQHQSELFDLTYNPDDKMYYITKKDNETVGKFTEFRNAVHYYKKLNNWTKN